MADIDADLRVAPIGRLAPSDGVAASDTALVKVTALAVRLPTGPRDSVQAVRSVSLTIRPGERVGIVGESGSGKSVTGRAIAGLLPESKRVQVEGSIVFRGKEMVAAPAKDWLDIRRRGVSMIFQDPLSSLNPTMRVGRQVMEACRPEGSASARELRSQAYSFMELAGLPEPAEIAKRFPFELSGGMRQRVLIAIALAKRPDLIIADEPTTALDVTVQARVLASLKRSVDELGASLLMISHDIAVVASLCDRVYVMWDGEVVESGDTGVVLTRPREAYTQRLLRSVRSLSSPGRDLHVHGESLSERSA